MSQSLADRKQRDPQTTSIPPNKRDTSPSTGCLMTNAWKIAITMTIGIRSRRLNSASLVSAISESFNLAATCQVWDETECGIRLF
jgi:hypothetical protein